MKGKALRKALLTDPIRVNAPVPLIIDTTELITPDIAKAMLTKNAANRPINWKKVEEYADVMRRGEWRLHAQGIMLDVDGQVLTGQKRLWAVIKAGCNIYMRVSRGNPKDTATLIDRGIPQSARDLASRKTQRLHSPTEVGIARAISVLRGVMRPNQDALADILQERAPALAIVLASTRGSVKTRELLMIIAAMVERYGDDIGPVMVEAPIYVDKLVAALAPRTAKECWGRGAAFSLAVHQAARIVGDCR